MFGVIGGSGLYRCSQFSKSEEKLIDTPFGPPSAPIVVGTLNGIETAFLPRHGLTHSLIPSEINYRANIWALKSIGVTRIIGVSAVGSLKENIAPGELALVGQYIDCTKGIRSSSFFGKGIVAHISMAEPVCAELSRSLSPLIVEVQSQSHTNQTYGCIEGPRFGTRAESKMLITLNCDLVGMTNIPEAFLAREAQICYTSICIVTDYDCWMEDQSSHVPVSKMLELYKENLSKIESILGRAVLIPEKNCACRQSLKFGLMTQPKKLDSIQGQLLEVLLR